MRKLGEKVGIDREHMCKNTDKMRRKKIIQKQADNILYSSFSKI